MHDIVPQTPPATETPRPLPDICQDARRATCGHCWQIPGLPGSVKLTV